MLDYIEGNNSPLRELFWGKEGVVSGGVFDHSTYEEDGLVTWEALASPRRHHRFCGEPMTRLRRTTRLRAHVSSAIWHRTSARHEGGHRQGEPEPWPTEARESESCIRAMTSGNGLAPEPGRAKAARVDVSFRREPCPTHRRWETCHWEF